MRKRSKSKLKISEKDIQKSILDYLTLRGLFCWRQNSGGFKTESGHFYNMGIVGAPDIFVVKRTPLGTFVCGQIYAIEVKDAKGKQNENQIKFQQDFEKAGGIYFVARSIEDVQEYGL